MRKLPKKLQTCPIVDSIIEIRFETPLDKGAVFGYIYSLIMDQYKQPVRNLPESQLPEAVRNADPNLRYKPLYSIEGDKSIIQIGTNIIAISSKNPYIGWADLSQHFVNIINKIGMANPAIIRKVTRLGLRYINFFEGDISDKVEMSFKMTDGYQPKDVFIRSTVIDSGFTNVVQFSNNVNYNDKINNTIKNGSIIDIDTSQEYSDSSFLVNIKREIDNAHNCEKKLFFSILKKDFIDKFKPIYNDEVE